MNKLRELFEVAAERGPTRGHESVLAAARRQASEPSRNRRPLALVALAAAAAVLAVVIGLSVGDGDDEGAVIANRPPTSQPGQTVPPTSTEQATERRPTRTTGSEPSVDDSVDARPTTSQSTGTTRAERPVPPPTAPPSTTPTTTASTTTASTTVGSCSGQDITVTPEHEPATSMMVLTTRIVHVGPASCRIDSLSFAPRYDGAPTAVFPADVQLSPGDELVASSVWSGCVPGSGNGSAPPVDVVIEVNGASSVSATNGPRCDAPPSPDSQTSLSGNRLFLNGNEI